MIRVCNSTRKETMNLNQATCTYFTIHENWVRGRGGMTVGRVFQLLNEAQQATSYNSTLWRRIAALKDNIVQNNVDPVDQIDTTERYV